MWIQGKVKYKYRADQTADAELTRIAKLYKKKCL